MKYAVKDIKKKKKINNFDDLIYISSVLYTFLWLFINLQG